MSGGQMYIAVSYLRLIHGNALCIQTRGFPDWRHIKVAGASAGSTLPIGSVRRSGTYRHAGGQSECASTGEPREGGGAGDRRPGRAAHRQRGRQRTGADGAECSRRGGRGGDVQARRRPHGARPGGPHAGGGHDGDGGRQRPRLDQRRQDRPRGRVRLARAPLQRARTAAQQLRRHVLLHQALLAHPRTALTPINTFDSTHPHTRRSLTHHR